MPLTQSEVTSLREQVKEMVLAEGLCFDTLARSASEIVVFGSRASGLNRPDSDLDLLIISDRSGHKKMGKLDLIFVPRAKADTPIWRRTEIARHIEAYGVSLLHDDVLIHAIKDDYAALRKQARLHVLIKSLIPIWNRLDDRLRLKYLTRVRRELERYRLLRCGLAVPPTAQIDSALTSSNWFEFAFSGMGDAANITEKEALLAGQLLTNEARRLGHRPRSARGRNPQKAA